MYHTKLPRYCIYCLQHIYSILSQFVQPFALIIALTLSTIKQHNLLASFNSVVSIYDIRAQELANLAKEIKQLIILLVSLFIVLLVIIILFNICYYDKAEKRIFLQRIYGFSFLEINKANIGLNLLATAIILFAMRLPWFGQIICLIWEAIILISCSLYLGKRNLAQVIKEQ